MRRTPGPRAFEDGSQGAPERRWHGGGRSCCNAAVRVLFAFAPLAAAAACTPRVDGPDVLGIVAIEPKAGERLLLNEEVTVLFDAPLEPGSVTRLAAELRGADGRLAEGTWRVDGRLLEFSPAPVRARDLGDGGFRPGETLTLTLRGYPSASALRSRDGRWLGATVSVPLAVVPRDEQAFLFYDATPGYGKPIEVRPTDPGFALGPPLAPGAPLWLRCGEPLDPTSLFDEDFRVEPEDTRLDVSRRVRLELVQNYDDEQVSGRNETRALLAVHFESTLPAGGYTLHFQGRPGSLTDFRGFPVARRLAGTPSGLRFRVGEPDELDLDFVDDAEAVPLVLEGSDGTAYWSDDGRVRVRYPRAAGHGEHGHVTLGAGPLPSADLHAVRLTLPQGSECVLPESGPVVLRAQGRVELAGRLVRRTGGGAPRMFAPLGRTAAMRTLSEFIAAAEREGPAWTVIVAGGDLVVDGTLEFDGPLLLVAGGRVRGVGEVRLAPEASEQLWILGEGDFATDFRSAFRTPPRRAQTLEIDPPLENLLREPLVFSVVSSPLPRRQRVGRWREQAAVGGGGQGTWRVLFAPSDLPAGPAVPRGLLTDVPWEQPVPGPCRMAVELLLAPPAADPATGQAPRWDPPFVDRVHLAWLPE